MTNSRRNILGAAAIGGLAVGLRSASATTTDSSSAAGAVSVASFGVVGDGKTDNSKAIGSACEQAISLFNSGTPAFLQFPSGNFCMNTAPPPIFQVPIGIKGAGAHLTTITAGPDFSGNIFGWTDCWMKNVYGADTLVPPNYTGISVQDISFCGTLGSSKKVNALAFYNINDFVRVSNVEFNYIPGHAIVAGEIASGGDGFGILRESRFNEIRIFQSGTTDCPCIQIGSTGSSDATNEIIFAEIDIFWPRGHGFLIFNSGTEPVRLIKIFGLRVEKVLSGFSGLQLGGAGSSGIIYGINAMGVELVTCDAGATPLSITGTSTSQIYCCAVQGQIVNCKGDGIVVNTGYGNKISMLMNETNGTGLTVTETTSPLYYDCPNGSTYSVAHGSQVLFASYATTPS